jgi:methyl-accepting chemotaxis protein
MKGSMRAATAIGVGYLLGRHRKFRTAAMVAAGMTVGGTTIGSLVMKRGMKMLGSTDAIQKVAPQLGDLADVVRGDLVAAGKAAATAAVNNRVDALTDSIHDRAERVRNPVATAAEGADAVAEGADAVAEGADAVAEGADAVAEGADKAAETGRSAARSGGRAATGTAKRATSATSRVTGRGKAARPEDDEADLDDYEADDFDDRDEPEGDESDEGDNGYEADDREDEADTSSARRTATRRRSPVTRARR